MESKVLFTLDDSHYVLCWICDSVHRHDIQATVGSCHGINYSIGTPLGAKVIKSALNLRERDLKRKVRARLNKKHPDTVENAERSPSTL